MITIMDEQTKDRTPLNVGSSFYQEEEIIDEQTIADAITHTNPTTQLLLSSKLSMHTPDAGLNPLVDAAAYLFSTISKLKHLKSYRNLAKLHSELVYEIEVFRENAKAHYYDNEYISEYIPITCYALCATLDDVIATTPWGMDAWKQYSLLETFYQDSISHEGFFIILERLIRDPEIYIDIMEFMYFCLNLGFKGQYKFSPTDYEHLEQITNALYKRIRIFRGDLSKTLSPNMLKTKMMTKASEAKLNIPDWAIILLASGVVILALTAVRYLWNFSFGK